MQNALINSQIFLDELNNTDEEEDDTNDLCLISSTALTKNFITLPCLHSFNYIFLLKAVIAQKKKNPLNILNLAGYQIQCPYCRSVHHKLLPFIPNDEFLEPIKYVNSPQMLCMVYYPCTWVFKTGKNKNNTCCKNGYEGEKGVYCTTHHKYIKKIEVLLDWDGNIMNKYKSYTVSQLKTILHERKLKVGGEKRTLIRRIVTFQ
jgi:hypothetical protein